MGPLPVQVQQIPVATPTRLLTISYVTSLLTMLDKLKFCVGNHDVKYIKMIEDKRQLTDKTGIVDIVVHVLVLSHVCLVKICACP